MWSLIDTIILFVGIVISAFTVAAAFGLFLLLRAFIRHVCGDDDDTLSRTKPLARIRMTRHGVETEIADEAARKYPNPNALRGVPSTYAREAGDDASAQPVPHIVARRHSEYRH